ncbi:MAG TPA: hypothetical protein VKY73_03630 [Polyangiaceae bacterium]|nr:hypothetical protein [Polyangiaceae bacterium]
MFVLVLSVLGSACGSGGTPEAASPDDAESDSAFESPSDDAEDGDPESASGEEASSTPRPLCDDGSCIPCGDGMCPVGWYCDEDAGPACSWIPECAPDASCGCLRRVLGAACRCNESGPAPTVSCQ